MTRVTADIPSGVDKDTAQRVVQRAIEQVAALGLVERVLAESPTSPGPGHLAQAALREERWREVEAEWGMLSDHQVAALSGANPKSARLLSAAVIAQPSASAFARAHHPSPEDSR